jgi:hypothetical protein
LVGWDPYSMNANGLRRRIECLENVVTTKRTVAIWHDYKTTTWTIRP